MKNAGLIITILVLLIGGYFAYQKYMTPSSLPSSDSGESMMEEGFTGSAKAAMALGIPMKCEYTLEDGTVATGYIKGGMYAGQTTVDGEVGNILVKDNCSWTWSDTTKEGVTFCSDPEEVETMVKDVAEEIETDKPTVETDTVNVPDVDFNCSPTTIDESMYTPPTDVEFTDFSAMMEGFDPESIMPSGY